MPFQLVVDTDDSGRNELSFVGGDIRERLEKEYAAISVLTNIQFFFGHYFLEQTRTLLDLKIYKTKIF